MMTFFLSVEQVIQIHDFQVQTHGGMPGIRDLGLLTSAVELPKGALGGKDLYPTLFDKAAAYLFHIVQNHPFADGNKRTGAFAAYLFLKLNGVKLKFDWRNYETIILLTAQGSASKAQISRFFKVSSQKKKKS